MNCSARVQRGRLWAVRARKELQLIAGAQSGVIRLWGTEEHGHGHAAWLRTTQVNTSTHDCTSRHTLTHLSTRAAQCDLYDAFTYDLLTLILPRKLIASSLLATYVIGCGGCNARLIVLRKARATGLLITTARPWT